MSYSLVVRLLRCVRQAAVLAVALSACSDPNSQTRYDPVRLWETRADPPIGVLHTMTLDRTTELLSDASDQRREGNGYVRVDAHIETMVALLEVPANRSVKVKARLTAPPGVQRGDPAASLRMHTMDTFPGGASKLLEAIADTKRGGGSAQSALARFLCQWLERDPVVSRVHWVSESDEEGMARLDVVLGARPEDTVWALMFGADRALEVGDVEVSLVPEWNVLTEADRGDRGEAARVRLWGEGYPSLWVPPGGELRLAARPIEANARLSFTLALDVDSTPGCETSWRIICEPEGGDAPLLLGEGAIARRPAASFFEDHELPCPPVASRSVIRVQADGEFGCWLGRPMVLTPRLEARRCNLLLISLDTLRADHLGAYGYPRDVSPFLDRFAVDAAVFDRYYAVAPYTLPTHASMLTGRLPPRHGAVDTDERIDPTVAYLPRILADRGYVTAAFTGGGFLAESFGFADGFDRYGAVDPILIDDALPEAELNQVARTLRRRHSLAAAGDWVRAHHDQSWCLFVHSFIAHSYKAPPAFLDPFDTAPASARDHDPIAYIQKRMWHDDPPTAGDIEALINRYDASIRYADQRLEEWFVGMEREGLLDDAVVVITSDHGEEFWEHGSLKHSVTLYDEVLRVPLILRAPGVQPGRVATPTSQVDLMPTLLDLLGLGDAIPAGQDGRSVASVLRGEADALPPRPIFAHVATRMSNRASLRAGAWKVIESQRSTHVRQRAAQALEIYNTEQDPAERTNRSASYERRDSLLSALQRFERSLLGDAAAKTTTAIDAELDRQLRELGYTDR